MSSVLVWILYDIVEDKIRNKVAKECKKYGLIAVFCTLESRKKLKTNGRSVQIPTQAGL